MWSQSIRELIDLHQKYQMERGVMPSQNARAIDSLCLLVLQLSWGPEHSLLSSLGESKGVGNEPMGPMSPSLAETHGPDVEAKLVRDISAPEHSHISHRKQVEVLKFKHKLPRLQRVHLISRNAVVNSS